MTDVEKLITEMQELKAAHPTLELSEILRIFNIKALRDLAMEISKARMQ